MTGFLLLDSFKKVFMKFIVVQGGAGCDEMCRKMKPRECIGEEKFK